MNQGEHKRILTRTVLPTVAAVRGRFCSKAGEQMTTAGAKAVGVFIDDYDAGDITKKDGVAITSFGLEEVQAGAAFALGAPLASDADGKGRTATAGQEVNAIALEAATAADQRVLCLVLGTGYPKVASAFVADPAGGATVDAESRAAIAAILDILVAHGIMAAA